MRYTGRMGRTFADGDFGHFGREEQLIPPPTPASQRSSSAPTGPRSVVGSSTLQNHGKNAENQDAYIASNNGTKSLVAVLDGHGEQGRRVSEYARSQLAKSLFSHKDLHTNPASALESAYAETQRGIERAHNFDALHSGCTAVCVYRHRDRLVIANCGDSRAVLGCVNSRDDGDPTCSNGLRAIDLSSDQRPAREDEKKRILAQGGSVHQSAITMRKGFGPPVLVRVGPERVWDRTGRCGLCVTRSLGDLSMAPFVIAQPEVSERMLSSKDRVLILGSDGVWDRLDSQEAVDIAAKHTDPNVAAREITTIARQRWHAETQGQVSDDITAVVMHLDHSGDAPPLRSGAAHPPASMPTSRAGSRPRVLPLPESRRPSSFGDVAAAKQRALGSSQRLAAMESLRATGGADRFSLTAGQAMRAAGSPSRGRRR
eukprot:gb/GFBE01044150.1/.p1 GENE.gb/GFBE01044150.1/~~gb/GFBE01044150.1/.p1  ORF type:complete len:429 (+),score=45.12 gb/GFBE01044150.1/:1-1287(+)